MSIRQVPIAPLAKAGKSALARQLMNLSSLLIPDHHAIRACETWVWKLFDQLADDHKATYLALSGTASSAVNP
jgi:hypothetical protein